MGEWIVAVHILSGGKSSRMGRNKASLPIHLDTFSSRLQKTFTNAGFFIQETRPDIVPGRGPISGIHTALKNSTCNTNVFLACDMPVVDPGFVRRMQEIAGDYDAIWTCQDRMVGFPFILRHNSLAQIEEWMRVEKTFSLQEVSKKFRSLLVFPNEKEKPGLLNINTPEDYQNFLTRNAGGV